MKVLTAVVLLNWNGWRDTLACLSSIHLLNDDNYVVIVVDNSSTDGSSGYINSWVGETQLDSKGHESGWKIYSEADLFDCQIPLKFRDHIFIQASRNGGFAFGNNLGIRFALASGCEYVWLLNNDTEVDPDALSALIRRTTSSSRIGMCGSIVRFFDQPEKVQVIGGGKFNFWIVRGKQIGEGLRANDPAISELAKSEPDYIAGASMLLTRDFLLDVGLMEEDYFLYFEEIDWAVRAKPRWSLAIASDSVIYHKEGASIGTSSRNRRSALSQYYLSRNLLYFYAKRFPVLWPIALVRIIREIIAQLTKRDWELAVVTLKALKAAVTGERGKSIW